MIMQSNRDNTRPAIWAEGSQKPAFEPRAFMQAAVKIARETMAGLLTRCSTDAGDVGGELKAGRMRIPEDRLGRTGRYLPTAESTGRAVLGGAGILRRAAEVVQPNAWAEAPRDVDPAYRDLFRDGPQTASPVTSEPRMPQPVQQTKPRAEGFDELAAIRNVLAPVPATQETAHKTASRRPTAAERQQAEPAQALTQRLRNAVSEGAARVLGYWMIAFAFPYGAIRAGIAHLNGEDLRRKLGRED